MIISPAADTAPGKSSRVELVLCAGVLFALGFSRMFRNWLFDGFDGILGEAGDARIVIALLEHWYRVIAGNWGDWLNPPFFYPERGALGFTDAYLLYAVVYSPLRLAGIDPFTAFMLVMAVLSAIGFIGFMRLAIADLRMSAASAAVGAFLFVFANMMATKMMHVQCYCAMLLPVVVHLSATAYKAERKHTAIVAAAAAGLLHALIFATAYLTGWFATLFVIVFLFIFAVLRGARATKEAIAHMVTAKRHVLAAWIAGFAIGIVPFLIIYGPVWLQGQHRSFDEVRQHAPVSWDIINVGPHNWAWSWLLKRLGIVRRPDGAHDEVELGFTPGVAVVCVLTSILAVRSWRRATPNDADTRTVAIAALGLALAACWLVQLHWLGLQPWYAIWALVPGASAVRTTFRFQIVLNLVAALLVAWALDYIRYRWPGRFGAKAAAACVAGVLIVEQISRVPLTYSRAEQLAWMQQVPTPPPHCRVFYLVPGAVPAGAAWWVTQSDVMLLAIRFGIPTVNGNSSVFPAHWRLQDPSAPDYPEALRDWLTRNKLTDGLCGLRSNIGPWVDGAP